MWAVFGYWYSTRYLHGHRHAKGAIESWSWAVAKEYCCSGVGQLCTSDQSCARCTKTIVRKRVTTCVRGKIISPIHTLMPDFADKSYAIPRLALEPINILHE